MAERADLGDKGYLWGDLPDCTARGALCQRSFSPGRCVEIASYLCITFLRQSVQRAEIRDQRLNDNPSTGRRRR